MFSDKRGQGLSVTTIIIIVLALVVLVFLIYGFTVGFDNLFGTVTNVGQSNLQTVVQACELACTTGSIVDYCTTQREVKFDREASDKDGDYSCLTLQNEVPALRCSSINCANAPSGGRVPISLSCGDDVGRILNNEYRGASVEWLLPGGSSGDASEICSSSDGVTKEVITASTLTRFIDVAELGNIGKSTYEEGDAFEFTDTQAGRVCCISRTA